MVDNVESAVRSRIMASVKQSNTKPEVLVRSILHKLGFRFRLHRKDLPSKPDIVLSKYKTVVFVHGCFWHQHEGCRKSNRPTSNVEFWNNKLDKNVARDERNIRELNESGWKTIIVWECELKNAENLKESLINKIIR